jgi:hypothetical protein
MSPVTQLSEVYHTLCIKKALTSRIYPGDESMILRVTTPVHCCFTAPTSARTNVRGHTFPNRGYSFCVKECLLSKNVAYTQFSGAITGAPVAALQVWGAHPMSNGYS